jgi:outer membrane protein assembly factor BamB
MKKSSILFSRALSLVLIIAISQLFSCLDFDIAPLLEPVGTAKLLWQTTFPSGYSNSNIGNVHHNNRVLLSRSENNSSLLYFIDNETGEVTWKWSDRLANDKLWVVDSYQNGKLVVVSTGISLYCIDLETGLSVWKREAATDDFPNQHKITGIGDSFYLSTSNYSAIDDIHVTKVTRGNIKSGLLTEVIVQMNEFASFSAEPVPIGQDEGILTLRQEKIGTGKFNASFSLYNQTKNTWEYQRKLIDTKKYNSRLPVYNSGRSKLLLFSDSTIYCIKIPTADLAWSAKVSSPVTSVQWLANGSIIATSGYYGSVLHNLEAVAGNELWKKNTNVSGILVELKDVLYARETEPLLLSSREFLSAFDARTGNVLWRIEDNGFQSNAIALPSSNGARGKIIVSNATTLFCFEAIR